MRQLFKIIVACFILLTANACTTDLDVIPTLQSISLSPANASLEIGETQQFTVTATYSDHSTKTLASRISWGSSNMAVATVSSSGLGTAAGNGVATITATEDVSSLQATASITVSATSSASFVIGGSVTGLSGTLVLQNNSSDDLTLTSGGSFSFATSVADGEDYAVTVLTQPAGQTCTVTSGSGTVEGADVTNVTVSCAFNAYTVGGTVSGLADGESAVLQNNGADNKTINANGAFTFTASVAEGASYNVTVLTQPSTQTCAITSGSGTGGANVTNVGVTCVSNDTTLTASLTTLGLSVNDTGLNAALTGNPRLVTLTNTGTVPATNVTYSPSPALPSGTTISPASCGTIAASDTCVLTITPGSTPSAAAGDAAPTPITLSISGTNTNTLTPTLDILTYGSVYQGGYVYAVDDTTPDTGSIGGKVAALTDQSAAVIWSSDGSSSVSYVAILGIDELSTTSSPSPTAPSYLSGTPAYVACNGNSDGACNTSNIVSYYDFNRASGGAAPTPQTQYAAGICKATIAGRSDWYLPAICETGYDDMGGGANGCGTQAAPAVQNMLSNLFDAGVGGLSGEYWSSTEWSGGAALYAWSQTFDVNNIPQFTFDKSYNTIRARCSRALTP